MHGVAERLHDGGHALAFPESSANDEAGVVVKNQQEVDLLLVSTLWVTDHANTIRVPFPEITISL